MRQVSGHGTWGVGSFCSFMWITIVAITQFYTCWITILATKIKLGYAISYLQKCADYYFSTE